MPSIPARGMLLVALAGFCIIAEKGKADRGLNAIWNNGQVITSGIVFPNWTRLRVGSYDVQLWDTNDGPENIVGLTVANFGTADEGDISGVYWEIVYQTALCPGITLQTMTYAGTYLADDGTHPVWTWTGFSPDLSKCADPTGGAVFTVNIYADVSPCPEHGAMISMGFPVNTLSNTTWGGSITDQLPPDWGSYSAVPFANEISPATFYIRYVHKIVDRPQAAPGDTVNYTIYCGRPGTDFTSIEIVDSLPDFTHYLAGSSVPPPDLGWAPRPGPPKRLKWTLTEGGVQSGRTTEIRFQLTVDWGNGDSFEFGAGDEAPPERARLYNQAQAFWWDLIGCGNTSLVSDAAEIIVKRFMFWKVGNNDMFFASVVGQPDDEMIYEIFIKNLSEKKILWKLNIWDTVPDGVDVWIPGYGIDDPFLGWTMTPTTSAPANAGVIVNPTATLLTWHTDLAPSATLGLRWKCRLNPSVPADSQITNIASLLALGSTGIDEGTGGSVKVANFTHVAKVLLRTTYYSYTSFTGSQDLPLESGRPAKFLLPFFPIHNQTNFELRKLEYSDRDAIPNLGGKTESINQYIGSCVVGFLDGGNSHAGCKAERSPACYWPMLEWDGPFVLLYKVTSNAPVLWQTMSLPSCECHDSQTFAPSTSLSYRGFTHYCAMRPDQDYPLAPGHGDRLAIVNTGMDAEGNFDPDRETTVYIFKWEPTSLSWSYLTSGDIAGESIWMPLEGTYAQVQDLIYYYRVISSDAQNIIYHGFHTFGVPPIGGAYDNYGTMTPNRENGGYVNQTVPANFYIFPNHAWGTWAGGYIYVGNTGTTRATYRFWKYKPDSNLPLPNFPATMAGNSGTWIPWAVHTVEPGLDVPGNAHVYGYAGEGYDESIRGSIPGATPWKIELLSGGPIQVNFGMRNWGGCAGASGLHDAGGTQWGDDFWLHTGYATGCGDMAPHTESTMYVNVFCPRKGMAVSVESTGTQAPYATYVTDGPDQCIVFMGVTNAQDTDVSANKHNYRFYLETGPGAVLGSLICQYHQSSHTEKGFTAPFVATGIHYRMFAPPVAYLGQDFWMTVVVIESGTTKTDYFGVTNFTSTDPQAQIMSYPMDSYDYAWDTDNDQGVKLFINVSMSQMGMHAIVTTDMEDGSITGLTTITVVGVDVKLTKEPPWATKASGDEVQFKICWSNYSSASASEFVITDRVPNGFTYVPDSDTNHFCGGTLGFADATVAYSTTDNNHTSFQDVPDAGTGTAIVTWLRWTIPMVAIRTTGCVCFRALVN